MRTCQKIEKVFFLFQDEKHQLFLTLKKVLNEDETRRRKETDEMNIMYGAHSTPVLPIAGTVHTSPLTLDSFMGHLQDSGWFKRGGLNGNRAH
jgi:hypothetical protein